MNAPTEGGPVNALPAWIEGIGLLGPGLASWAAAQGVLRGDEPHRFVLSVLPAPPRLPPAERRRAGPVIRLAMAVAEEAVAQAGADPQALASVFSSSGGEGANCHSLCETLASADPLISPTRFTNSVHNAAAGYWHIAVGSRQASTSLCAFDGSFGAGLIEAVTQLHVRHAPLLLVAYDLPYPKPLNSVRPLPDNFGLALLLTPAPTPRSLAALRVGLANAIDDTTEDTTENTNERTNEHANDRTTERITDRTTGDAALDACADASLDALRRQLPAAAALPLLQRLARGADGRCTLAYLPQLHLRVDVQRCGVLPIAPAITPAITPPTA